MADYDRPERFGPELKMGHRVVVAKNKAQIDDPSQVFTGLVVGLGDETCNIWAVGGKRATHKLFMGCRHADDPEVPEHPGWFESDDFGLYRLSEPEILLQTVAEKQQALEKALADLEERAFPSPKQDTPPLQPKRGPGRPRKHPVPVES